MATSRIKTSSVLQGFPKSRSLLAGNAAYDPGATWFIERLTGTGSNTSFTFSSIPTGYSSLQLRGILRDAGGGGASSQIGFQFNASGSYTGTSHWLGAIGDASPYTNAGSDTSEMYINYLSVGTAVPANIYGAFITNIHDYASTTRNKTIRSLIGVEAARNANATQTVMMFSNLWIDTSAINEIKIINKSGRAFTTESTIALYGIK